MFLGIDLSRHAATMLAITEDGAVAGETTVPLTTYAPQPGWSEQPPNDWWDVIETGCRSLADKIDLAALRCIAVTAEPAGFVALDREGNDLRPAILADDARATASAREGIARPLAWIEHHDSTLHGHIAQVLTAKAYLVWGLTGKAVTDPVDAALTGIASPKTGRWTQAMVRQAGLTRRNLPTVTGSSKIAGAILPAAAEDFGLPAGCPVLVGPAHPVARYVATGCPSAPLIGFGATATVGLPRQGGDLDDHAVALQIHGGLAFDWVANLGQARNAAAALAEASARGRFLPDLFALPFPGGDRRSASAPGTTATLLGMTGDTTRADMVRAVAEAVCFGIADAVDEVGIAQDAIPHLVGAPAESLFFCHMLADILDRPIDVHSGSAGRPAFGAALCARNAIIGVPLPPHAMPSPAFRVEPEASMAQAYQAKRQRWNAIIEQLSPIFQAGAAIV